MIDQGLLLAGCEAVAAAMFIAAAGAGIGIAAASAAWRIGEWLAGVIER